MSEPPPRNMTTSLPSRSRPSFIPRIEPSASPSGFSWVTRRMRSWARTASTTAATSFIRRELVDELRHPHASFHRRIVFEGQLRSPLETQLPCDARLEHAVGGGEAGQALLALPLRPEDADEDSSVPQVGGRLHPGDRDEPDAGVLELR